MKEYTANEPVRDSMLPYGQQFIDEDDVKAVTDVLKGDYITQGPAIAEFEKRIANLVGAKHAVAFCNGTAALHGACFAAGVSQGDEVITTPNTFVASANCVLYQGATPVFADVDMNTYNIDPDEIRLKINEKTKVIIPVDFSGQPAEIDTIMKIAQERGIIVIHDAAHSLGATYRGRPIGSWADMTMFSFHPVKHITTGEGGVIVTNNDQFYQELLMFRSHGITRDAEEMSKNDGPWYYEMLELGYNYRMTDMQAALGSSQLNKLDNFIERRRQIVAQYNSAFQQLEGIITPIQHTHAESSWHLYVLRWDLDFFDGDRRLIFEALRKEGIGVHVHYIPVYKQPYYQRLGYQIDECPNAEKYYRSAITLPLFPRMSDRDVEDVIRAVKKVYTFYKKVKSNHY